MSYTQYQYLYTTREEVTRLISSSGVTNWTDDLESGDVDDYFDDIINDATGTINQYLEKLHNPVDMASSPWIRRRATYIASYHLTKRRGDPGLYGDDYDRIIAELADASDGMIQVPGLPFSSGMLAVMQNVLVDQRYIRSRSRVVQSISTDTGGREPLTYRFPYDWL